MTDSAQLNTRFESTCVVRGRRDRRMHTVSCSRECHYDIGNEGVHLNLPSQRSLNMRLRLRIAYGVFRFGTLMLDLHMKIRTRMNWSEWFKVLSETSTIDSIFGTPVSKSLVVCHQGWVAACHCSQLVTSIAFNGIMFHRVLHETRDTHCTTHFSTQFSRKHFNVFHDESSRRSRLKKLSTPLAKLRKLALQALNMRYHAKGC